VCVRASGSRASVGRAADPARTTAAARRALSARELLQKRRASMQVSMTEEALGLLGGQHAGAAASLAHAGDGAYEAGEGGKAGDGGASAREVRSLPGLLVCAEEPSGPLPPAATPLAARPGRLGRERAAHAAPARQLGACAPPRCAAHPCLLAAKASLAKQAPCKSRLPADTRLRVRRRRAQIVKAAKLQRKAEEREGREREEREEAAQREVRFAKRFPAFHRRPSALDGPRGGPPRVLLAALAAPRRCEDHTRPARRARAADARRGGAAFRTKQRPKRSFALAGRTGGRQRTKRAGTRLLTRAAAARAGNPAAGGGARRGARAGERRGGVAGGSSRAPKRQDARAQAPLQNRPSRAPARCAAVAAARAPRASPTRRHA
jgi:hypothetical protein